MRRSAAFPELIERHDRALRALAFRLLGDRDRMDDVLQEAYVRAYRALPRFRGRSLPGTWLYRIVYNACIYELRRERPDRRLPLAAVEAAPEADPADVAAGRAALVAALAAPPVDQ